MVSNKIYYECKDETWSYKGDKLHMTDFYTNKVMNMEVELFE